MALLKPYASSRNWVIPGDFSTVPRIGSTYLWALYRMLINGAGVPAFDAWSDSGAYAIPAWTVDFSCDGTTAGTPHDGVDRWGSPYNASVLVQNTETNPHSWMVLKSPASICSISKVRNSNTNVGPFYILIDLDYTNGYTGDFFMSKLGFTGGTASARPTATDELIIGGGGAGNPPNFFQNHSTSGAQRNMTLTFANDGTFWAALVQPGASTPHVEASFFALERDNDARQLDVNPLVFGVLVDGTPTNPPFSSQSYFLGSPYVTYGAATVVQYSPAPGSKLSATVPIPYISGDVLQTASLIGGNVTSSDGQYFAREAWLFAQNAGSTYHDDLGRLVDCYLRGAILGASPNPGDAFFEASKFLMGVGNMWLPCTGVINT